MHDVFSSKSGAILILQTSSGVEGRIEKSFD